MGLDFSHDRYFLIDRPNGSGDNLVLIFKSPAKIQLDGTEITAPKNSAIVFTKTFHQHYGACGENFINHWVHFNCEEKGGFAERIGLPFNTIIPISDIAAVEEILRLLSIESVSASVNSAENKNLLLRLLLSKLSEGTSHNGASPHSARLRELRAEIYRQPADSRSIAALAEDLSLSPSHFQYLYKQEFGVSCYEDIISARLDTAKYYLETTAIPIKKIAELCGCENDVHFMRQFKKRVGVTPSGYRKSLKIRD